MPGICRSVITRLEGDPSPTKARRSVPLLDAWTRNPSLFRSHVSSSRKSSSSSATKTRCERAGGAPERAFGSVFGVLEQAAYSMPSTQGRVADVDSGDAVDLELAVE